MDSLEVWLEIFLDKLGVCYVYFQVYFPGSQIPIGYSITTLYFIFFVHKFYLQSVIKIKITRSKWCTTYITWVMF